MIDNPDGSKRLPTKEEILENARSKRSLRSDNNSSQTAIGTNQSSPTENRRFFSQRRGETYEPEGRDRLDEGNERSANRTNNGIFGTIGASGVVNSSTNEYSERASATTASQREYASPLAGTSKFKPYADAVKQAFKKKPKDNVKPVTTKKVLTKQEIDSLKQEENNLKEKLVDSLLWQSDHIDEFIVGTTKGHIAIVIWSDLDRSDATIIANFMIERAKTDKQMAYIVREMISLKDKIQLALIILPRLYKTLITYLERGIGLR